MIGVGTPKVVVATGVLVSKDPAEMVGDSPIGPNHWKILVEHASVPSYKLGRPYSNVTTIRKAIGKTVAWPKGDVSIII